MSVRRFCGRGFSIGSVSVGDVGCVGCVGSQRGLIGDRSQIIHTILTKRLAMVHELTLPIPSQRTSDGIFFSWRRRTHDPRHGQGLERIACTKFGDQLHSISLQLTSCHSPPLTQSCRCQRSSC